MRDGHIGLVAAHSTPKDFFDVVPQSKEEKDIPRVFNDGWLKRVESKTVEDENEDEEVRSEADEEQDGAPKVNFDNGSSDHSQLIHPGRDGHTRCCS